MADLPTPMTRKGRWVDFQPKSAGWVATMVGAFTPDNDPHGKRDFDSFEIEGKRPFWKIEYLQRGTPFGAEDPSDDAATSRIITIMLAQEW